MRARPGALAIFYLAMGALFTYLAINSAAEGLWTFPTIIMMLIATFDFAVALRMLRFGRKLKRNTEKK
ncbi:MULTISPECIES: YdiK family protein [Metabacillus]|uniref:YdiK family protein n=2 Tax=Metabacillus TaxID=2675233 RepID=A0ABS5L9S4_9BACI|nr:YdiK family protein [Metabacillus flavus]MBS2967481.1 YdiK family protein [Metabacillus flavus]